MCDYYDAYVIVKGSITIAEPNNDTYDKKLALKSNTVFISCISKINNILIDNAENLNVVMPTYNLIEYTKNYSKTSGSLWNYLRDEPKSGTEGNIYYSIKGSKYFDYKKSIT